MKISILTIGDELCIGQVINTNASWIAQQCVREGSLVLSHSVIGDSKEIIKSELNRLIKISDLVIITGGLGPTHDDITKITLCEFFKDSLILNNEILNYLTEFFNNRGMILTERNREQALVPATCTFLINTVGTAPGMLFEKDGHFAVSLPGVPNEMRQIMNDWVIPFIHRKIISDNSKIVLYKNLLATGIAESSLADLIGEPSEFLTDNDSLAFLPSYHGIRLRIGTIAQNLELAKIRISEIEAILMKQASKYIISIGDDSLIQVVAKLLIENKLKISTAESCTAGLLSAALTDIPGSSEYFIGSTIVYHNNAKINVLGIFPHTILENGAVSKETAEEMALKVRELFKTDIGISITGIAGPDGGTPEKPVGTIWIALAYKNSVISKKFIFGTDRASNRQRAVGAALIMIYDKIKEL